MVYCQTKIGRDGILSTKRVVETVEVMVMVGEKKSIVVVDGGNKKRKKRQSAVAEDEIRECGHVRCLSCWYSKMNHLGADDNSAPMNLVERGNQD